MPEPTAMCLRCLLLALFFTFIRAAPSPNRLLFDREITRKLLASSPNYGNLTFSGAGSTANLTVGIIGAGAAGLYSAILLQSLGVDYEILEANNRVGGRIWTHYFDEAAWAQSRPGDPAYYDYVDIGAMRIPSMPYMDRLSGNRNFSLFNYINANTQGSDRIKIIPFLFNSDNSFLLFNDVLRQRQALLTGDPFGIGQSHGGAVPEDFASQSPSAVWDVAVDDFIKALNSTLTKGYQQLMALDSMSVREYLRSKKYTDPEVTWLETTEDATGHYDQGLTETILEQWIFSAAPEDMWITVEGGLSRLVNGMVKTLKKPVVLSQRVQKISMGSNRLLDVSTNGTSRQYSHVINTAPLPLIQAMDLRDLQLDYGKKLALRALGYDPAAKIGVKFKSRWWEKLPQPIRGGGSLSDLPIRHCVFPSYGVNTTNAPGTMIASYTWGQDAARLGAYMTTSEGRSHLIDLTLQNLAQMNNVTSEFLQSQYVDSFPYSWYNDEHAQGAFAFYGPGQFSTLLPALLQPAADGRLHFAGEALSSGNGWIIGALNSAYRAVAEVLAREQRNDLLTELVAKWGEVDEIDMGWYHGSTDQVVADQASTS